MPAVSSSSNLSIFSSNRSCTRQTMLSSTCFDRCMHGCHRSRRKPGLDSVFMLQRHEQSLRFADHYPIYMTGWADATQCLNAEGCSKNNVMQQQQQAEQHCIMGKSEREEFENSPSSFLKSRWHQTATSELPSHLVMFPETVRVVHEVIYSRHFFLHKAIFNCHIEIDAAKEVLVWKRLSSYPWQQ